MLAERRAGRPMRAHLGAVLVAGALLTGVGAADARGPTAWMRDSAYAQFNEADTKLLRAALDEALASPGEGTPVTWQNERSGSSGSIEPVASDLHNGVRCRDLKVVNRHRRQEGEGRYRFCQPEGGAWKLVQ
jgi:surface antigen